MTAPAFKCARCHDCGWLCENHPDTPSGLVIEGGCECGAGMNCECNPNGHVEFEAVWASTEPEKVKAWVQ